MPSTRQFPSEIVPHTTTSRPKGLALGFDVDGLQAKYFHPRRNLFEGMKLAIDSAQNKEGYRHFSALEARTKLVLACSIER